jgi:arsenate reductase
MIRVALAAAIVAGCSAREPAPATVVFVCDHGSAKSIVAAALFNDLAAKRALPWRAVARGFDPDPTLAPIVVRGLASDRLVSPNPAPVAITGDDRRAARVIYLGDAPRELGPHGESWTTIPPVSKDYAASRDAIRAQIELLLGRLSQDTP